jgi:hypothetical protein
MGTITLLIFIICWRVYRVGVFAATNSSIIYAADSKSENCLPKGSLKWARTSGTSCTVACIAESERPRGPHGRRGKRKRRLNYRDSAIIFPAAKAQSLIQIRRSGLVQPLGIWWRFTELGGSQTLKHNWKAIYRR